MLKPVRRKGQKFWSARGTVNGVRIERSTKCTRKSDAEAECRRIEDAIRAAQGHPDQSEPVTFARAVTYYIELGHSPRFIQPLLTHFGTAPVDHITGEAVQQAAKKLYPGRAAATVVRQVYTPMTAILNTAAGEGWCAAPKFKRPKVIKRQMQAASPEWFEALLTEAPPRLAALLCFMATTGCRITEALFADFDLKNCRAIIGRDKRGKPKEVAYPVWVQAMIANLPPSNSRSIFGYAGRSSAYKTLRRVCDRAGIEYLTPHQAGRHTFATNLLKAGKSLAFVKDAGHWSSGKLVMETYGHLERSDILESSAEVGENWGSFRKKSRK